MIKKTTWKIHRLDEIATITMGQSPPSSSYNSNGEGVPFIQGKPSNITAMGAAVPDQWTSAPTKTVTAGTALITVRAPVGELFTTNDSLCIGRGLAGIKANKDVSQQYLNYYLQQLKTQLNAQSQGSTFSSINSSELKKLEVRLPKYDTQEYIAKIIISIDRAIEKTEHVIQKNIVLRSGLMNALLTKGLHCINLNTANFPRNWIIGSIEDIVIKGKNAIKPGPFGSSLKKDSYVEKGYKVYGQEQVIGKDHKIGNYYVDEKKFREMEMFSIKEGDVLISLVGTIGQIAVVTKHWEKGLINPRLMKVSPDLEKCVPEFLAYLLSSDLVKSQLNTVAQGGTMDVLNGKSLRLLRFGIPPINEQKKIVEILGTIDRKIEYECKKISKLRLLKNRLTKDIFNQKI